MMKRNPMCIKDTEGKGAKTFFIATRGDLLECLDERRLSGSKAKNGSLNPPGRSIALKTRMPE
ncbi:MAG: hypothetical protein HQL84_02410 [Magnetococcales bacterium]|nr:hypothetical protein [Magnetococcales bacterium]MBF0148878.1 hypothetical protein [Magnetococcales bacterium]MBF0174470.1 hypothetical protein [Magnetococcales bacterium]MBF0348419.1 hypothetical protein [Magnetococcales bacterium]MBF0630079.1 hypothetical protein [Magnetococcales bacterium]